MLGLVATGNDPSADMQDLGDGRVTRVSRPSRSSGEGRRGLSVVQTGFVKSSVPVLLLFLLAVDRVSSYPNPSLLIV